MPALLPLTVEDECNIWAMGSRERDVDDMLRRTWIRAVTWRSADERGGSLVEYLLLVSLIAIVAMVAVVFFGDENSQTFSSSADAVAEARG